MDMAWTRYVYAPLAAGMLFIMYNLCHAVVDAIATGVVQPSQRLPAVRKSRQPVAYWSYVIALSVLVIPALALGTAAMIGLMLDQLSQR